MLLLLLAAAAAAAVSDANGGSSCNLSHCNRRCWLIALTAVVAAAGSGYITSRGMLFKINYS
jgi:hypothetical protein